MAEAVEVTVEANEGAGPQAEAVEEQRAASLPAEETEEGPESEGEPAAEVEAVEVTVEANEGARAAGGGGGGGSRRSSLRPKRLKGDPSRRVSRRLRSKR